LKKKLLIGFGGFFVVAAVLMLTGTPFKLLPGYYAKEFCSCYFVVGQDEEYCQENSFKIKFPALSFVIDDQKKEIVVKNLFRTGIAKWTSVRHGCQLMQ